MRDSDDRDDIDECFLVIASSSPQCLKNVRMGLLGKIVLGWSMTIYINCHWTVNDDFHRLPLIGQWQFLKISQWQCLKKVRMGTLRKICHWPVNDNFQKLSLTGQWQFCPDALLSGAPLGNRHWPVNDNFQKSSLIGQWQFCLDTLLSGAPLGNCHWQFYS